MQVFAKGASDTLSLHLASQLLNSSGIKADLNLANRFAAEGLRVLAFGVRDAERDGSDYEGDAEQAERDLSLVGVTAVEDLLQDDVARCIEEFR